MTLIFHVHDSHATRASSRRPLLTKSEKILLKQDGSIDK